MTGQFLNFINAECSGVCESSKSDSPPAFSFRLPISCTHCDVLVVLIQSWSHTNLQRSSSFIFCRGISQPANMSSKIKILVPVKRVIDAALKPRINQAHNGVESKGVKYSINPFDDIAVEEACRMKKTHKDLVESIHAVSIGPSKAKDVLRTALGRGADTSTLVDVGDEEVEPLVVSKLLKGIVETQGSNLVLLGKQAIDDDSNQVGQMLAGLLGWSQATNAAKITIGSDGTVEVEREIDGGVEVVKAPLPMIITTDLRLNEPKFVTLPKMMKAKKKPLEVISASDLNVELKKRLETISLEEPAPREPGVMVKNVDELISKLKELKAL